MGIAWAGAFNFAASVANILIVFDLVQSIHVFLDALSAAEKQELQAAKDGKRPSTNTAAISLFVNVVTFLSFIFCVYRLYNYLRG